MQLLLETLRYVSQFALTDEAGFVQKIRQTTELQQESRAKELKRKLRKDEKRCKELDTPLKKLYESYALGKLPEKQYEALSAEYEQEQTDLEETISAEQKEPDAYNEDTTRIDNFLALVKKYTDFTELTPAMIHEFVDKILVHKPEKIDGERVQEVEIYLKYIGKVEIPAPEMTQEEMEAEAKAKERRRKKREQNRRYQARKKEKLAEPDKAGDIA